MNSAPLTVQRKMLASRVHRTFVTLGMRHLCVVNHANRIVGIITRKDLEHAAEEGHHGGGPPCSPMLTASRSIVASSSGVRLRLPDGRRPPPGQLSTVGEAEGEHMFRNGSSRETTREWTRIDDTVEVDVDSVIAEGLGADGERDDSGGA